MSTIFGVVKMSDSLNGSDLFKSMKSININSKTDKSFYWEDDNACLGSNIVFNTPQAVFEEQPLCIAEESKVMVVIARLDNRDDLCSSLKLALSEKEKKPDSFFVKKAFEKWGSDCVNYLLGDWSFAVYDKVERKFFLARDQHGIMACYYYIDQDFLVFSSTLKGIINLSQVRKTLNNFKIVQILSGINLGGVETFYNDILYLPPAHTLTIENNKVITNRYWYLENTPKVYMKNENDYIFQFYELYKRAVTERLRSFRKVGATLSAGLDSGSVVILGSEGLSKKNSILETFTSVPLYSSSRLRENLLVNEGELALELVARLSNVKATLCYADVIGPLLGIQKMLEIQKQPSYAPANAYWILDILEKCSNSNIGALLIGQAGNLTITWPPNSLQRFEKFSVQDKLFTLLKVYIKIHFKSRSNFLLNSSFIKKYHIDAFVNEQKMRPFLLDSITKKRIAFLKPGEANIGAYWFELGTNYNLEIRDPTMDIELMKFLVSIPEELIYSKTRLMFESNFSQYFRPEILDRRKFGVQAADIVQRLEMPINELKNYLMQIENLCEWINLKKLENNEIPLNQLLAIYSLAQFIRK